ncbi:phage integrase SAM-like domain-containing protein [Runella sp. SP2]|uniref:phage integrase SAM-like domain-containing protein n=1 Tax=Runella sp. SP2 TaxID=2268026 RepID=UPI0013DDB85D|nr:phage integrase SAM-like domain-containing protein [Runella sp. SP2]
MQVNQQHLFLPYLRGKTTAMLDDNSYSETYIRRHLRLHSLLAEFCPNDPLDLSQINNDFMASFESFLMEKYRNSSVATHLRLFKTVLKSLCDEVQLPCPVTLQLSAHTAVKHYTTYADIIALLSLKLSWSQEHVRDKYVIQCYTGLDFHLLNQILTNPHRYHIKKDNKDFFFYNLKFIPLPPTVVAILDRRSWQFRPSSLQYYNRIIKEIASQAGLQGPFSSRSAIYSFAANALNYG